MSKPKILFTSTYGQKDEEKVKYEALGYEVFRSHESAIVPTQEMLGAEILVCFDPFPRLDLTKMRNLKLIQLVSKGMNHVPVEIVKKQNILVANNPHSTSIPIAEWIVTYLLQLFKNTKFFYRNQDRAVWENYRNVLEVCGKTIGFIGTGNIAREAAKRLKAFDATVVGVNEVDAGQRYFDKIYGLDGLDEMYGCCDAIISAVPSTPQTHHMLNAEAFLKMKDGVSLINISRGSIINTEDLIVAIKSGKFRGVALDVFEEEPLPSESPLWSFENVIITPHNVLWSDLYDARVANAVYTNVVNHTKGNPINDLVNFERGY